MCSDLPLQFCPSAIECWWGSTVYTLGGGSSLSPFPVAFLEAAELYGAYVV